jgi:hypothetical protein
MGIPVIMVIVIIAGDYNDYKNYLLLFYLGGYVTGTDPVFVGSPTRVFSRAVSFPRGLALLAVTKTYHLHYRKVLGITVLSYDPYFLFITIGLYGFGITGI